MADNYLHQSNNNIEYYKTKMYRSNMDSIPFYPLPPGYSIKLYEDNSNDELKWAEITTAAGEFRTVQDGYDRFINVFLKHKDHHLFSDRLYFLLNQEGKYIGTAWAWFDELNGEEQGCLHWVSIIPEYQGKKLAKPLVTTVLKKISEYSTKCFLFTQTTSWKAINMYADLGFKPYMNTEDGEKAWTALSKICHRNFLDNHNNDQ